MQVLINLALTKEEAKCLLRLLGNDPHHTDWETLNKMEEELREVLNLKENNF